MAGDMNECSHEKRRGVFGPQSSPSPTGVAMSRKAGRGIAIGAFLIALSSCLLSQEPAAGQTDRTPPAATAAAAGVSKAHDDTFVIGNDDVLAINVWKE